MMTWDKVGTDTRRLWYFRWTIDGAIIGLYEELSGFPFITADCSKEFVQNDGWVDVRFMNCWRPCPILRRTMIETSHKDIFCANFLLLDSHSHIIPISSWKKATFFHLNFQARPISFDAQFSLVSVPQIKVLAKQLERERWEKILVRSAAVSCCDLLLIAHVLSQIYGTYCESKSKERMKKDCERDRWTSESTGTFHFNSPHNCFWIDRSIWRRTWLPESNEVNVPHSWQISSSLELWNQIVQFLLTARFQKVPEIRRTG